MLIKVKYFAYLHENRSLIIKRWSNKRQFMDYLNEGLLGDSAIKLIFMPFEVELDSTEMTQPIIFISFNSKKYLTHPAYLYVKCLIEQIDWEK